MQEIQETQVQSLGQEDPVEEEVATCSSILVWEIPWTEEPGWQHSVGSKESNTTEGILHACTRVRAEGRGSWGWDEAGVMA